MSLKRRLKPSAEFSMSSIADIVFLLLIFFMLTSSFVSQAGVTVDLPKSKSENPTKGKSTITITEKGKFYWNDSGIEIGKGKSEEEMEIEVRKLIERVLTDENETNNVITLRTDKAVTMGLSTIVISEVARHGGKVVIATKRE